MRIILHIGTGKTGTSSIQESLFRAREKLLENGILYPDIPGFTNQNFLAMAAAQGVPREYQAELGYDLETLIQESKKCWDMVKSDAEKADAKTVILSGEYFFSHGNPTFWKNLISTKFGPNSEIEVICYVRAVEPYYISAIQQHIKGGHNIEYPYTMPLFDRLEKWNQSGTLTVREFSREKLIDGDVVSDFLETCELGQDIVPLNARKRVNETISAESMSIIVDYRRTLHAESENKFMPDSSLLFRRLRLIESEIGGLQFIGKPQLTPAASAALAQKDSETEKINTGYALSMQKPQAPKVPPLPKNRPLNIEDIFIVDSKKKSLILSLLIQHLLQKEIYRMKQIGRNIQ